MSTKDQTIAKVEQLPDGASVRLHFTDGTTLRMSRQAFESGSWKNGTSRGLVKGVQG